MWLNFYIPLLWISLSVIAIASSTPAPELLTSRAGVATFSLLQQPRQALSLSNEGDPRTNNCTPVCQYLSRIYQDKISPRGTENYTSFETSFWSIQQSTLSPLCIFRPQTVKEVAVALHVITQRECPFSVRSGGHAAFAGASNIEDGIAFDLRSLDEVTISEDGRNAVVGAGSTWYDVYKVLETRNLTAVGARDGGVGVGGFILGGGISYVSNLHGWACNNVLNYELVGADGGIRNIDASHPELFHALCGGGNNFGIVTHFTLNTFPQGPIWQNARTFNISQKSTILDAYVSFSLNAPQDIYSMNSFTSFGYEGGFESINMVFHNLNGTADPAIFDEIKEIPTLLVREDVEFLSVLSKILGAASPPGFRNTYWTYTFKVNREVAGFLIDTFLAAIQPLKHSIKGLQRINCVLQSITTPTLTHMRNNDMGLSVHDGPYTLALLSAIWTDESDDKVIHSTFAEVVRKTKDKAQEVGVDVEFLYMNYASQFQDPIRGYGEENVRKLREAAKYDDPEQVLRRLLKGGFKIYGGEYRGGLKT
ncbi:hypothetical protein FQN50_004401 [Emmonsiellopsis sp. PD_5]|nr:hypothetical protein FQN50_004401 [Emmonsiellopsis sp. PD_5]